MLYHEYDQFWDAVCEVVQADLCEQKAHGYAVMLTEITGTTEPVSNIKQHILLQAKEVKERAVC